MFLASASGDVHGIGGPRHNRQVGADVVQLVLVSMINALTIGHLDTSPLHNLLVELVRGGDSITPNKTVRGHTAVVIDLNSRY